MSQEIQKIRRIWLGTIAFEFLFFFVIGVVWMFFFSDEVHVWWLMVPVLPVHWALYFQRKKWCKCPHCGESLLGVDGDSIFSKLCEHCGRVL